VTESFEAAQELAIDAGGAPEGHQAFAELNLSQGEGLRATTWPLIGDCRP
jgi:hypothetical protein